MSFPSFSIEECLGWEDPTRSTRSNRPECICHSLRRLVKPGALPKQQTVVCCRVPSSPVRKAHLGVLRSTASFKSRELPKHQTVVCYRMPSSSVIPGGKPAQGSCALSSRHRNDMRWSLARSLLTSAHAKCKTKDPHSHCSNVSRDPTNMPSLLGRAC